MTRETINILLVEDDEAHAEAVKRAFQATAFRVDLHCVFSLQQASAYVKQLTPDLVIADWLLPDGKGTDILPADKEQLVFPAVLMTSYGNEQLAVSAMKAGAVDYVVKSPSTFAQMPYIAERALRQWDLLIEHRRAQEALRESERRFRLIFEETQDCIFLKDLSFRYADVNPAFEQLVGLPASKIIGLRHEDLFGREAVDHIREVELRVLRGETVEEENTRKVNGSLMTFLDTRIPLKDESETIVSILGISRDITDRKKVEGPRRFPDRYPSKAMQFTLEQAELAAQRDAIVLLMGESGSGKDYLAKYIHDHSSRSSGPYFAINCAAIPAELAESELFGHARGAFTGAAARKRGLLELAEGGTLLLNEIGELPLSLQAKLLTFLDTKRFTRVGGESETTVNARLIAATHRDLKEEVATGRFRKDLYYRLNVMAISMPPLRDRLEDIPVLVRDLLGKLCQELQIADLPFPDPATIRTLKQYDWPGNVRELRNVLERGLMISGGKYLDLSNPGVKPASQSAPTGQATTISFAEEITLPEATDQIAKAFCIAALERTGGNKKTAASVLGISRDTLYRYLEKFRIGGADR